MQIRRFRPFIVAISLALTALACNRSAATVTPVAPLPTPTPSLPPVQALPTHTATASPPPTAPATDTPPPSPTPTPVIPLACPPPGDPDPPDRPAAFDDYPDTLAAYLSAGGSAQGLTRLLRDWGAITLRAEPQDEADDAGEVRSLDLTGDTQPEFVVALIDPAPEFDLPWPTGDVLIFQCRGGAVVLAHQGRAVAGEDVSDLSFTLRQVEDVNGTGRADVVYVTSTCGAHTCFDRLYVVEWDGTDFVDRVPTMDAYPYATFTLEGGQILVDVGGIGSAGAGYQRSYREVWAWDGKQYTNVEQVVGPPTALIHYVHDGDDALAQGDYSAAMSHYQAALDDPELPAGLLLEGEEQGKSIVRAYARFKLVVANAATGDGQAAQSQSELLLAEHPEGTPGHPYALMGQAFWSNFLSDATLRSGCAAAVALAENDPTLAERLYAGYANPEYEPADLCRVGE